MDHGPFEGLKGGAPELRGCAGKRRISPNEHAVSPAHHERTAPADLPGGRKTGCEQAATARKGSLRCQRKRMKQAFFMMAFDPVEAWSDFNGPVEIRTRRRATELEAPGQACQVTYHGRWLARRRLSNSALRASAVRVGV